MTRDFAVYQDGARERPEHAAPVATATAPVELNGYPVIRSQVHASGYVTVMMQRATEFHPFIVATWYPELTKGWVWGHYVNTLAEATEAFAAADKRNARR